MGDRLSSMLFFVVLIVLAFVQSLPLSDKEYGGIRGDDKKSTKKKGDEMDYSKSFENDYSKVADDERVKNEDIKTDVQFEEKFNQIEKDIRSETVFDSKENLESGSINTKHDGISDIDGYLYLFQKQNGSNFADRTHRHKRFAGWGDLDNKITPNMSPAVLNPYQNTHLVPCAVSDKHFCLNGGICVLVRALEIKTCRCPIKYTGVRCEMIDIDYMLSLLTNGIPFSGSQYDIEWSG